MFAAVVVKSPPVNMEFDKLTVCCQEILWPQSRYVECDPLTPSVVGWG